MRSKIETSLSAQVPPALAKALLDAHTELKENFFFGKFRPSELEGGRFAEAAIRVVQHLLTSTHVAMNKTLPRFDKVMQDLETATGHDSLRVHIPRALWMVYGVRNRRDVGHIGGDVNPNRADAHLVVSVCDWVLAELIRLTFSCSLVEAQAIVDDLVERKIPIVQDFNGFPKILRTDLSMPDRIMALAYVAGAAGMDVGELQKWLRPAKNAVVLVALLRLDRDKAFMHRADDRCFITSSGIKYVESNIGFVLIK
jgi:hypothetical protein